MARYLNDQAKVVLIPESGTYANPLAAAATWPGQVQSHDIVEEQNVIETRYLGNMNRNISQMNDGPLNVTGKLTLYHQDWRLLGFAMGSITTTSGTAQTNNY